MRGVSGRLRRGSSKRSSFWTLFLVHSRASLKVSLKATKKQHGGRAIDGETLNYLVKLGDTVESIRKTVRKPTSNMVRVITNSYSIAYVRVIHGKGPHFCPLLLHFNRRLSMYRNMGVGSIAPSHMYWEQQRQA